MAYLCACRKASGAAGSTGGAKVHYGFAAVENQSGRFHKPAIQIPNAMSKTFLKSYEFLYDKKGNAYLFSTATRLTQ